LNELLTGYGFLAKILPKIGEEQGNKGKNGEDQRKADDR
jgi:hypothetical protein